MSGKIKYHVYVKKNVKKPAGTGTIKDIKKSGSVYCMYRSRL